jgi:hypothetical protein
MALADKSRTCIMRPQTMVVDPPITLDQLEQRQAHRPQFSQSAIVSALGTASQVFQGEIRNVSSGGTQLQIGQPVGPSSLLKIEYDNNLLLGEVVYCQRGEAGWIVGIRIEHVLSGLTALADALHDPS